MSSPPTTLGQYQIIREIARSNDIVYEAYDPNMDRRVALKELNMPAGLTPAQTEDRVQRFDREAKAAGRLAHPNIMRVFQVSNDGNRHFMAMEYLDGHTLRNEIDTKGFLPVDRAVEIGIAVLKGLGHAHANGVVHRDIKPDNIQLLTSGEIKITDFGIARLTFQPNLTMDGQVFGTPSYMSPEQVVGREIDARSDLFSVGVLLYEMISGHKPFGGDSVVSITYAIMNSEPEALTQVNHSMWQVISRALDKSSALRFSSAQEMIEALESAAVESVVLDPPRPAVYGSPYPAPPPLLPPYGGTYPPGQALPPVVYPYNPYQQGAAGGAPPHTPGFGQPGFPQLPVYYPPPPRQPLLKPATKHFIGKLFLTTLVMGTLFAVVILFIAGIGQAISNDQKQRQDRQILQRIAAIEKGGQPDAVKAQQIDAEIPKLKSDTARAEQSHRLAILYERMGQDQMVRNDLQSAEQSFKTAHELDAENPKLMTDLAALYGKSANEQPDPTTRFETYTESIKWWNLAADGSTNVRDRESFREAAAKTYLVLADELFRANHIADAETAAEEGISAAPESSTVRRDLQDLLDRIRQYR